MCSGTGSPPVTVTGHSEGCVCERPARSEALWEPGAGAQGSQWSAPGYGQQ